MRKVIFLGFFLFVISSCSLGNSDDNTSFSYEILPVEHASLPDSFILNETYRITVSYFRPSNCHFFNDFYYEKSHNERIVAVISSITNNINCEDLENDLVEVSFNFIPTETVTYVFKFWQGLDQNDNDQYLIIEVPVLS